MRDFADTIGVFEDEWALTIKEHYVGSEQRFVTIGMDILARILVIIYTYRGNDIRIISARKATKSERKIYEKKEYDFEKAKQGAIMKPAIGKTRITIRIDTDILNWFRNQVHETGVGNYQTLINGVLREYIQQMDSPLERSLRKVIREELKTIAK